MPFGGQMDASRPLATGTRGAREYPPLADGVPYIQSLSLHSRVTHPGRSPGTPGDGMPALPDLAVPLWPTGRAARM